MCNSIINLACTLQPKLAEVLLDTIILKQPSASVKPERYQGLNFNTLVIEEYFLPFTLVS